ncbi:Murein DD-endopeptidase MepM and murein hydrolase activator NlpD, contain LysM domain [Candidatus Kryptobacter tengchongensis]|uniref:Murein DD-endopeptidase MepM and murein hydrolase activator NlpD, contain LysM domain n=1 Tax=Kryptobacter tengchongensis TaxID=1643429 RepID=A0A656CYH2_KRYT1|nr:M23 family metallopeptidase [Candidatus Kryptobacter tengchongensis]CUS87384.1 Murein DD-endopeptidase MepM and murein hydrolase activator NlpD, contain LysM domain [Candidatus Kryptobacter tengchongensis]CUT01456.1 Murein DD-endopeptidase MepM and murein hydrolase activator NlpD, contain LysM domain [Candidatus Kryptobacter tengchongensis]CUU03715.1 Murein DD-endopeptidase MepM and murein hydrolase activator NlpD, contain LysM domain [Candidatus Kryptobacter tengchongensis]
MGRKVFYIDTENLSFNEVRNIQLKFLLMIFLIVIFSLGFLFVLNYFTGDILGFGKARAEKLQRENNLLKEQLKVLREKFQQIESMVAKLLEQDRELRLAVDLKPIDEDIKKVGVGSVEEKYEFNLSDEEAEKLLAESFAKLSKLEREVRLQQKSYEEIYRQYKINQEKFRHIPAILPLKGGLTSKFGYRKHPILGVWAMHEGVDLVVDVGTPVYATGDGVVSYVGYRGRYGLLVEIDHGFGYVTIYAHLSKAFVREGQKVKRGDRIALSGATGLVTAPHLHYEVWKDGIPQNPLNYFFEEVDPAEYKKLVQEQNNKTNGG